MRRFYFVILSLAFLTLLPPMVAKAVPPAAVNQLQADFKDDGRLTVSCEKLYDESITLYRVYYSDDSILLN